MTNTPQDSFLQAILENPEDDALRLVFADYLEEECGESDRADFIRVQIELSKGTANRQRQRTLQRRERSLLAKYAQEWAEPLRGLVQRWEFVRGFIEKVEVELATFLPGAKAAFGLAPIRHLRDQSQCPDIRKLLRLGPLLTRLRGLELWNLWEFDQKALRDLAVSPRLANLNTLILFHDRNGAMAEEDTLLALVNSPHRSHLTELTVGTDGTWRGLPNRVILALAQAHQLAGLSRLSLSACRMTEAVARAVAASPFLGRLKELNLGACQLGKAAWRALLKSPNLSNLRWLGLFRSNIDESDPLVDDFQERCPDCFVDTDSFPFPGSCDLYWSGYGWKKRKPGKEI
jgi:uncharacterized protein (TIGR02996 family)